MRAFTLHDRTEKRPWYLLSCASFRDKDRYDAKRGPCGKPGGCHGKRIKAEEITGCSSGLSRFRAVVKVRSMMAAASASIALRDERALIVFDEPQWAPAPGQSAVFYDGDTVIAEGPLPSLPKGCKLSQNSIFSALRSTEKRAGVSPM